MRRPLARFVTLLAVSFGLSALIRFGYYCISDGFALPRIENTIPADPILIQPPPSHALLATISHICQEPFYYFKKGSQAYAFQSKNGNAILKLYKCHHLQPADWLYNVPTPSFLVDWRNRLVDRRQYKRSLAISSFMIAHTLLKEECGIIYAQVLPMTAYTMPATLFDATGRSYRIDLSRYGYALQKKARLIFPSLTEWIDQGDLVSAKKALASIIGLLVRRSQKGIQDSDPDLHKNAGLIGTDAIFIDIGSFHKNDKIAEPEEMRRDIQKISKNLDSWLQKKSPELHDYFISILEHPEALLWKNPA